MMLSNLSMSKNATELLINTKGRYSAHYVKDAIIILFRPRGGCTCDV